MYFKGRRRLNQHMRPEMENKGMEQYVNMFLKGYPLEAKTAPKN